MKRETGVKREIGVKRETGVKGTGFSPYIPLFKSSGALAPEGQAHRALTAALLLLLALPAAAQYTGKVSTKDDNTPTLRAVAVLEWTGPTGKPKQCRLVPITIYDGDQLQDASLYMSRPEPLAVADEVEYQLKQDGRTIGLFDIENAGQEQGSWVGYGKWKPVPNPKPAFAATASDIDAEDDDKPVLHRKHAGDTSSSSPSGASPSASGSTGANAPAPDSDRPTLHQPSSDTSAAPAPSDPDRPVLKKPKPQKPLDSNDTASVSSVPGDIDPDRPHLVRGKSTAENLQVVPSLMGLPPDMQQAVAVSDAANRPDHPWTFTWANSADQDKMKSALEDIARTALGLDKPAASPPRRKSRGASARKPAKPVPPSTPAQLQDEQFRVFELSYGAGATMVLSADTGGPLAQEKFVTLIAQPDLYGKVLVLVKNVTDGAHLDDNPRMRLVDAVDALADNRGELLFELRGIDSRQFALYRVLRGQADRIFVSTGGFVGTPNGD